MATVFVSHASADGGLADEVFSWLRSEGHVPFLDRDSHHGLEVGEAWEERLYRELRAADAVICLLTTAYRASRWCFAEVAIAKAVGSLLLPVRAEPQADHPLLAVGQYQYVDYAADLGAARDQLGRRLRRLDAGGGVGWSDDRSPFPGLEPFSAELHQAFFGRRDEVRALTGRLRALGQAIERGLVVVVGPSGCGKSSLVRAGLLPALAGDPDWVTLPALRPGTEPTAGLARLLTATAHQLGLDWTVAFTRTQLGRPDGLAHLADELLVAGPGPARQRLLVAVDQAEELLTVTAAGARADFVGLLRGAVVGPVQLVATLRSEFLDLLLADPALAGLPVTSFPLRPLARDLLPEVIEGPARLAGLRIDAELVGRLVADTGSGDALPLLAFTLNQLAAGLFRGEALSAARYAELGGVQGALAGRADAALAAAEAATGRSGDEIVTGLLQLVTVDEQGRPVRQRVDRARLTEPVRRELDTFVAHRLLTTDVEDGTVWLGVAHEAVLSGWLPLAQAIRGSAVALRARQTVEQAAADWTGSGRRDAYLWERDRILAATALLTAHLASSRPPPHTPIWAGAIRWLRTGPPGRQHAPLDSQMRLSPIAAAFLHAGLQRAEASERRARRRRIQAFTVLSVLVVLALVAADIAFAQRHTAQQQQRVAVARGLVAQADAARNTNPRMALLLSIAAQHIHASPETQASLVKSLTTTHYADTLTDRTGSVYAVAFGPDGRTLATASNSSTVILWDLADRARPRLLTRLTGHDGSVFAAAFAPDGRTLVTGSADDTAILWDLADRARPRLLTRLTGYNDSVFAAAFAPDGRTLVTGSADNTAILWDLADRARPRLLTRLTGHDGAVRAVAFAPDGRTLVTGSADNTAILWDLADRARPRPLTRLTGHTAAVNAVAFAPDGRTLVTGSADNTAILWDLADRARPRPLTRLTGHDGAVNAAAFAPDGRTLVTGSADNTAILWDLADRARPRPLTRLTGHTAAVRAVAFAPDGRTLVTGSADTAVALWDLAKLNDFRNHPGQHACALAGRGLSRDEWAQHVSGLPYQDTCPP